MEQIIKSEGMLFNEHNIKSVEVWRWKEEKEKRKS